MKTCLMLLMPFALLSCEKKPHTDRDDLVSEWSADGKVMTVKRNGVAIASFRNVSNACRIELTGTDGLPDVNANYQEDPETGLADGPDSLVLAWPSVEGAPKSVAYDRGGNMVAPDAPRIGE